MVRPFICYRSRAGRFMKRPYMPPVFLWLQAGQDTRVTPPVTASSW